LIDTLGDDEEHERRLLDELRRQIGNLRRERRMSKSEIILVSM
jgi:archaellum component FlaC